MADSKSIKMTPLEEVICIYIFENTSVFSQDNTLALKLNKVTLLKIICFSMHIDFRSSQEVNTTKKYHPQGRKMGNCLLQLYGSKIRLSRTVFSYMDVINAHRALSVLSRHESHLCHQSHSLLILGVSQIRGKECTQTQGAMTAKVEMIKVEK